MELPIGRAMIAGPAEDLLQECVRGTTGDYIEIGSAWGGSAITAALAMEGRAGLVFCIDPFSSGVADINGPDERLKSFWANVFHFGVTDRMIVFKQHHPPFPSPIYYHKFSVGLIDGEHTFNRVRSDFGAFTARVTDTILIDNFENLEVERAALKAALLGEWYLDRRVKYKSSLSNEEKILVAFRKNNEIAPVRA